MKNAILIFYFSLLIFQNLFSQPTFIKRLSFNTRDNNSYQHPEDSVLSLLAFSESLNGSSFIIADFQRDYNKIFKLDLSGNILWSAGSGGEWGLQRAWMNGLHATPDGGCVFASMLESWISIDHVFSTITKLDSNGVEEWSCQLPSSIPIPAPMAQETYDIGLLPNGYACLSIDSTYLINSSGLLTGSLSVHGQGKLNGYPNGNILFNLPGFRGMTDSLGTILFLIPGEVYNSDTAIFSIMNDTLYNVNSTNGAFLNSVPYTLNGTGHVLLLSDGGWINYNSSTMWRYESNGTLRWTKNIYLPRFGITTIGERMDGTILAGGTYISIDRSWCIQHDFSFFVTTIDSNGQSVMDSTSQSWPGDADNDGHFEYGDAIYVTLAQGSYGPSRYDSSVNNLVINTGGDIAVDFPGSFAIGINHKFSDLFSDGIIDSVDIHFAELGGLWLGDVDDLWNANRFSNSNESNTQSLLPIFSCFPDRDSASAGDTVRFYFVIGDQGMLIDSIFGLAFSVNFDTAISGIGQVLSANALPGNLGTLQEIRESFTPFFSWYFGFLCGRRDLQNVSAVNDTIAYADILITNSSGQNIDLNMTILSFKAITAGGFPVEFQFQISPLHLRSGINSTDERSSNSIEIYPVPIQNQLVIDHLPEQSLTLDVFDYAGNNCYSGLAGKEKKFNLDMSDYIQGLYLVIIRDEERIILSKKIIKN